MKEVLREVYRTVLIQIAADLTEQQYKELLFYCKDYVPGKYLNISPTAPSSSLQIFDHLENALKISCEDLSYLVRSMRAIRREDLVTKLAAFEFTRELMIYAWKRQSSDPPVNPSASSVGHYLSEMMTLAQDQVDVGGPIYSLLQSGMNGCSILEAVSQPLLAADVEASSGRNWSTFALLVAIAAEIVSVDASKVKVRDHYYNYAVKLATEITELGNYLSLKLAKLGTWEEFCLFVGKRYQHLCQQQANRDSNPALSRQLELTDMVKKLKDTIFND